MWKTGFVRHGFCPEWVLSEMGYVRDGLYPEGLLSAHHLDIKIRLLIENWFWGFWAGGFTGGIMTEGILAKRILAGGNLPDYFDRWFQWITLRILWMKYFRIWAFKDIYYYYIWLGWLILWYQYIYIIIKFYILFNNLIGWNYCNKCYTYTYIYVPAYKDKVWW